MKSCIECVNDTDAPESTMIGTESESNVAGIASEFDASMHKYACALGAMLSKGICLHCNDCGRLLRELHLRLMVHKRQMS